MDRIVLTLWARAGALPRPKSNTNRKKDRDTERDRERGGEKKKHKNSSNLWLIAPGCWAEFRVGGMGAGQCHQNWGGDDEPDSSGNKPYNSLQSRACTELSTLAFLE